MQLLDGLSVGRGCGERVACADAVERDRKRTAPQVGTEGSLAVHDAANHQLEEDNVAGSDLRVELAGGVSAFDKLSDDGADANPSLVNEFGRFARCSS